LIVVNFCITFYNDVLVLPITIAEEVVHLW